MHRAGVYENKWICHVKNIIDRTGYSYLWNNQQNITVSFSMFKESLKNCLKDQFRQEWHNEVVNSSKCINYRIFKTDLSLEKYLLELPVKLRKLFTKFRCRNLNLPIETGARLQIERRNRLCSLCNRNEVGDEFHYVFNCTKLSKSRRKFISSFNLPANTYSMKTLFNLKNGDLLKFCNFIEEIVKTINNST